MKGERIIEDREPAKGREQADIATTAIMEQETGRP